MSCWINNIKTDEPGLGVMGLFAVMIASRSEPGPLSMVVFTTSGDATTLAVENTDVPLTAIVASARSLLPIVKPEGMVNEYVNGVVGSAGSGTVVVPRGNSGNRCGGVLVDLS